MTGLEDIIPAITGYGGWWRLLIGAGVAVAVFVLGRLVLTVVFRLLRVRKVAITTTLFLVVAAVRVFLAVMEVDPAHKGVSLVNGLVFVFGVYLFLRILEDVFIGRRIRTDEKFEFPIIIRDVIRLVLLVLIVLFALKAFLGFEPTALIATSTVVAAVIGFAMQEVLSNLIAGVALQIGKPFDVGHWVELAGQEGVVVEVSWRSTTIRTFENNYVTLPNSNIAKSEIFNFSVPTKLVQRTLKIGVNYGTPPNKVKSVLLNAAREAEGVREKPAPTCRLIDYGDFAITYRLRFWIGDYKDYRVIEDNVMTNVWYNFKRAGIQIPFPIRTVEMTEVNREAEAEKEVAERRDRALTVFEGIDIFKPLSKKMLESLAGAAEIRVYGTGEIILRQGDAGDELFIVESGQVGMTVRKDSRVTFSKDRGAGYLFGEMSLLTGEPRTATVKALEDTETVVIGKDAFDEIIKADPTVVEKLSEVIERRRKQVAEGKPIDEEVLPEQLEEDDETVLDKIKGFFNLG
jgi:small-conductance mechanosensitive channel/CRP-like cAMP-binding protein